MEPCTKLRSRLLLHHFCMTLLSNKTNANKVSYEAPLERLDFSVYFSIFGKIGVLVNFIIQKLKSKQFFSVFSGFFEGMRENILHIFRAQVTNGASDAITHIGFKMIRATLSCQARSLPKICFPSKRIWSTIASRNIPARELTSQNDNSKFISVGWQNLYQINNRCTFSKFVHLLLWTETFSAF